MEAHAKNSRKEIDYDVVRRFGNTKDSDTKEKLSKTKFHHLGEEDISTDPQEKKDVSGVGVVILMIACYNVPCSFLKIFFC